MTKSFKFRPTDVGLSTQRIIFELEGNEPQEFPIPGVVLPENGEEKFRLMYKKLVEFGAITDQKPIYQPSVAASPEA